MKSLFWGLFTLLIAVLIVNVVFFVMPLIANLSASFTPAQTITVSAEGQTTATPDLAEINFSVVTQGTNPSDLETNDSQKSAAVMQFLTSQGIASSDIATTGYDLEPNYQYDKTTQRNYITGYTLTDTVEVKIHDLTTVPAVLGGLAPLGVNQIGGVTFTFNDPDEFVAIARADAMTKAEAKATEIAGDAGVTLGRIMNINESENVPGPLPYPIYAMASAGSGALSVPAAPNVSVSPGTQDVTDNVTITYEIK